MPRIKIEFYRVYLPDDYDGTFEELLREIRTRPAHQRLARTHVGWTVLHSFSQSRTYCSGIILKAKADEIPAAANQAGELQDLHLGRDQGIAGLTHFYYRPTNRVLLLQRHPHGVWSTSFETYVEDIAGIPIELRPIINREVMQKLRRLRTIRKIAIKLANPRALEHYNAGRSIKELIDLMNDYNAPIAEVTLSMGHERGSLNRRPTVALLERLFGLHGQLDEVKKIIAYGREHEEERMLVLDLLRDRMIETADVPVGDNRRLSDDACAIALQQAYERRHGDIEAQVGD
jgi:hypothetical protein